MIAHTIIVHATRAFSIRLPLQLSITQSNQGKCGKIFSLQPTQTVLVFVPYFFNFRPPSICLSHISSIANECLFSFSFYKYLYKCMARIQPSFLCFHLFPPRQHKTSILLTPKGEIKYPGVIFLSNPNLLLCPLLFSLPHGLSSFSFSTVNKGTLFLYLFGQLYFSFKHDSKLRPWQDFAHILPNFLSSFSTYPLQHNGLASYQTPKILDPILGWALQHVLAIKRYLHHLTMHRH